AFAIDAAMLGAECDFLRRAPSPLAQQRGRRCSAQGVPSDRLVCGHDAVYLKRSLSGLYPFTAHDSISLLNGSQRSAASPARARPDHHALQDQGREFTPDPLDRGLLLGVPARHRVGHAENGERGKPRIEMVAKLAHALALADDRLEDAFDAA